MDPVSSQDLLNKALNDERPFVCYKEPNTNKVVVRIQKDQQIVDFNDGSQKGFLFATSTDHSMSKSFEFIGRIGLPSASHWGTPASPATGTDRVSLTTLAPLAFLWTTAMHCHLSQLASLCFIDLSSPSAVVLLASAVLSFWFWCRCSLAAFQDQSGPGLNPSPTQSRILQEY